ncbi:MAG: hypothetical protein ABIB55_01690 [Candidatus Nealsonbacteria bacterium]
MQQEKGQIPIVVLIVAIIAIVFFMNFSKSNPGILPSITPNFQEKIAPSQEQTIYSVTPVADIDTVSPFRSNPQPSAGLSSNTRETLISLYTNENATCRYSDVQGVFYEYMQYAFSETGGVFHQTLITALNEGGVYNFYVRCVDEQDNKNSDDFVIAFWVNYPADFTPPVLSNAYPSGDIRLPYTSQTMIGISTNEPASCRYSWTQGTAYNSMANNLSPDNTKKYHTANITGLVQGNTYSYFVRCKDLSGNANTGDVMISFTVAP